MATYTKLDSGKIRVQVRRAGVYRGATFTTKREAEKWAANVEANFIHVAASGVAPPPKGATLADLIDKYMQTSAIDAGKTKRATLKMLKKRLGHIQLLRLNSLNLRDFIDMREAQGAGGVTIAADLSFLSAVLKWAYHSRRLDVPYEIAVDARSSLKHRKNMLTRSRERDREPSQEELDKLYSHWGRSLRQKIDMPVLVRFALCTGMRLGEICRVKIEDIDHDAKTIIIRDRKDPKYKKGNDQVVPLLPDAWCIVESHIIGRSLGPVFDAKASSASAAFTRACNKLEINDLHFHDLRHKATADLFRLGLDIPFVALLTGHKTWAMLRRYTSIKPEDVHKAYSACQPV